MADPETGGDRNGPNSRRRTRLLALIATLLVIAALRAAYAVAMPLAFAAVIITGPWPVKPRLDRWLPSWLGYTADISG